MTKRGFIVQHLNGHQFPMVDHSDEDEKQPDYYRPHRCVEMEYYEHFHRMRSFVIRYEDGNWYLFDHDSRGMIIVQCPFCHYRMFVGNQVSIE